jgi:hypothetical protein
MKKIRQLLILALLLFLAGFFAKAQEPAAERAVVSFSNPAKPGTLEVGLHGGSITVRGYEGKEVIIEARWREKLLTRKETEVAVMVEEEKDEEEIAREKAQAAKAKGMKALQVESTGLIVEEEENVINVEVELGKRSVDLTIRVPYSTILKLSNSEGAITVEKVDGEIDVNSSEGPIILTGVAGPILADCSDGEIKAVFSKANPGKPMSLSAMDGDIDITLPADVKASLRIKAEEGKVFTDFDTQLTPSYQKKEEDERKGGGRYRVAFERTSLALINGGGVEIKLNAYEGNIYIRKAK